MLLVLISLQIINTEMQQKMETYEMDVAYFVPLVSICNTILQFDFLKAK